MNVEFNKHYEKDKKYMDEELLIIKELLEDSMKFKRSFFQFVLNHNPLYLDKIPFIFTDKFLSFFSRKKLKKIIKNINYFELINK